MCLYICSVLLSFFVVFVVVFTLFLKIVVFVVVVFYTLIFFQYNIYNTIIELISTPVPTVDNIRIQIYMLMLYIHNRQIHPYRHPYRQRVGQSTS